MKTIYNYSIPILKDKPCPYINTMSIGELINIKDNTICEILNPLTSKKVKVILTKLRHNIRILLDLKYVRFSFYTSTDFISPKIMIKLLRKRDYKIPYPNIPQQHYSHELISNNVPQQFYKSKIKERKIKERKIKEGKIKEGEIYTTSNTDEIVTNKNSSMKELYNLVLDRQEKFANKKNKTNANKKNKLIWTDQ